MTRTATDAKSEVFLSVLVGLTLMVLGCPQDLEAYSGDDFLTQLRTKFKTTSNIYLEAKSTRFEHNPTAGDSRAVTDTATVTLAYAYPRRFLQEISGSSDRSQRVILKDDSAIVSYPHLDFRRRYSLEKGEITRLLIKHIPIAGALLGVSSGAVKGDSITTDVRDGNVFVTVRTNRARFPYRVLKGKFDRYTLRPHYLLLRGQHDYRLDIVTYVEEERFPLWIEEAFATMDLKWFRESPS
jgi:hypothetical protein